MSSTQSKLTTLNCNHCGAPLGIAAEVRFVTCQYCSASLEIHRSDGAIYSTVLTDIRDTTTRIAQDTSYVANQLRRMDLEKRIKDLDDRWRGFLASQPPIVVPDRAPTTAFTNTLVVAVALSLSVGYIIWTSSRASSHGEACGAEVMGSAVVFYALYFLARIPHTRFKRRMADAAARQKRLSDSEREYLDNRRVLTTELDGLS